MVALQQPFDVTSVQPNAGPPVIPEAWYPAIIVSSELKPTKQQDGGYYELVFEIIDGEYKGVKQYDRLNVFNKNQQAVEMAYGTLSAIGWCVGVFNIQDTTQLHNIPLMIHVVKGRNERDGGETNSIKAYKDRNGQEPWKAGGGQQPQGQPPQGMGQQPPQGMPNGQGGGWQQQQPPQQGGWQQQQPPQQQPQQQPPQDWQGGGAPQQGGGWQQPAQGQQPPQGQPQGQQPPQGWQQQQQAPQGQPGGGWQPPQQGGGAPPTPPWGQR